MKLRELCEEFKDGIIKHGNYYEIYKNPTYDELRDMYKEGINPIRYIYVIDEKSLYVFSAELLHKYVAKKLGIRYAMYSPENIFGSGKITANGRIVDFFLLRSGGQDFFKGTKFEHLFTDK